MKKMICLLVAVFMILGISGCNQAPEEDDKNTPLEIDENIISQIYEASEVSLSDDIEALLNHKNIVSTWSKVTREKTYGEKGLFQLWDKEVTASYEETRISAVGEKKTHVYKIDGTDYGRVSVLEDGTIDTVAYYPLTDVEALPNESPEYVHEGIKARLDGWIDFSGYENCTVSGSKNAEGAYKSYTFRYYNSINGYKTDTLTIDVFTKSEAECVFIYISFRNMPELTEKDLNISQTKEDKVIYMKLADLFNTAKTKYASHKVIQSGVCMYNDELCRSCNIAVSVLYTENGEEHEANIDLLIPVRLLIEE